MMTEQAIVRGSESVNPVAATFDLLGDRLTLAILRNAFLHHSRRYNQWLERTGAPPAVLSARLNSLVEAGVLTKVPRPQTADRHEYRLTELGLATWEILICLWGWQREWTAEGALQPDLVHEACGHRGPAVVMCRGCGRTVTAHDTEIDIHADAVWSVAASGRRRSTRVPDGVVEMRFTEVMEAIGDRWSAVVTGLALAGTRRFSDFRAALDMSPTTLTERLTRLCAVEILVRPDDGGGREYRLTPRGRALFPVFAFLISWASTAFPDAPEPGLRIRHRECGAVLIPALRCRGCEARLTRTSVHFEPIPRALLDRLG